MSKEYTVKEFAKLLGGIGVQKANELCMEATREVGNLFIKEAVKRTPKHKGGYSFPEKFSKGYKKETTGLRKGWEENRNAPISKGTNIYTMSITNKAKSTYTSGYSGKTRSDYYAMYVDEGHIIVGGFKPILGTRIKSNYVAGSHFTDRAVEATENASKRVVNKALDKFIAEVFQ